MSAVTDRLWEEGELTWKLHAGQKKIYEAINSSTAMSTTIVCARQFGKSYLDTIIALEYAIKNPKSWTLVLAPTKKDAFDIFAGLHLPKITEDAPKGLITRFKSDEKYRLANGSEIRFAGFDTAKEALRGRNYGKIILDEVGFTGVNEYDYVVKSLLLPMLLHSKAKTIYTTTPPRTLDHPFYQTWDKAKADGAAHTFTIYDNPLFDEFQIQMAIDGCGGIDTVDFRREFLCERIVDGRTLIVPSFDASKNILLPNQSSFIPGGNWLSGDIGGMRDKSVIHVFGRTIDNRKVSVLAEFVFEANTSSYIMGSKIKEILHKYEISPNNVYLDAHGQTRVDIQESHGIHCILPPKLDRDSAISALNSAFYTDNLKLHRDCIFTKKSLQNCTFNENRTDFLRTNEFGHADAIMSLVYGFRVAKFIDVKRYSTIDNAMMYLGKLRNGDTGIEKFAKLFNRKK